MSEKLVKLSADRPALEIEVGGQVVRWEYDVLPLVLKADSLEQKYGGSAGSGFYAEWKEFLVSEGLECCTDDLALRVHSLIRYQFSRLNRELFDQLEGVK